MKSKDKGQTIGSKQFWKILLLLPSRTLISRHPHEEVPTPAPTPASILNTRRHKYKCNVLYSNSEFVQGATITMDVESSKAWHLGFHPYQHPLSLIVASSRSSMQHGNSIVASFRAAECEIPIGTGSGLT
ncbi:hypothetical protein F2Q68_00021780 [Brassica cretica]|uniref:Uncharacterized protein n=1 Tax=Brassica cretica TaxID=69181 RepID=A0A8S9G0B7_BRACR|nr:hypothetical protein F2Q68_00021780 [Brassica cretica]